MTVGCLADHGSFRCRSFADLIADDHRPGGDADPHRKLDPWRTGNRGIQLRHRGWEHVSLTGDYVHAAAAQLTENHDGFRPLRAVPEPIPLAA
jgi:hypothetical protein